MLYASSAQSRNYLALALSATLAAAEATAEAALAVAEAALATVEATAAVALAAMEAALEATVAGAEAAAEEAAGAEAAAEEAAGAEAAAEAAGAEAAAEAGLEAGAEAGFWQATAIMATAAAATILRAVFIGIHLKNVHQGWKRISQLFHPEVTVLKSPRPFLVNGCILSLLSRTFKHH